MVIVVTGGSGFIGTNFVKFVLDETNFSIINIDCLNYASNKNAVSSKKHPKRYEFIQADICNRDKITEILQESCPTTICHFAAETHVDRSIVCADPFVQSNIVGTHHLLECALKYWNKLPPLRKDLFKFIHISTDEVYGDISFLGRRSREKDPYAPNSPYAASKAASDLLVRSWFKTYNFPAIISHATNNFGPHQHPEKLIPLVVKRAIKGQPIPLYGNGQNIRDWLYVTDHVKAILSIIEKGAIGGTYNIGGENEKSNIEVVNLVCNILDREVSPNQFGINSFAELIHFVEDRPGHDTRYALNIDKINNELGWQPSALFETALEETVRWYLNNKHSWNISV